MASRKKNWLVIGGLAALAYYLIHKGTTTAAPAVVPVATVPPATIAGFGLYRR